MTIEGKHAVVTGGGTGIGAWKLYTDEAVFDGHVHELKGVISRVERVCANPY